MIKCVGQYLKKNGTNNGKEMNKQNLKKRMIHEEISS